MNTLRITTKVHWCNPSVAYLTHDVPVIDDEVFGEYSEEWSEGACVRCMTDDGAMEHPIVYYPPINTKQGYVWCNGQRTILLPRMLRRAYPVDRYLRDGTLTLEGEWLKEQWERHFDDEFPGPAALEEYVP